MEGPIKVTQISDTKYLVGDNETSLVDSNIIHVIARGEQTDDLAKVQGEINQRFIDKVEGQIHYLIDLNECGKNSPGARSKWYELSEEEKTAKVAIFGMHPVARVLASFVMKVSKKKNMQFFYTREEAMKWLKNA